MPLVFWSYIISDVPMNNELLSETTDCQCPFLSLCNFVRDNKTKFPDLVARIQNNYCSKPACCRCARFRIYQILGADGVPLLMLPDQTEWARQIVEECGSGFMTAS